MKERNGKTGLKPDERALFEASVSDVTPLPAATRRTCSGRR